jgi:hypothetical protein
MLSLDAAGRQVRYLIGSRYLLLKHEGKMNNNTFIYSYLLYSYYMKEEM